MRNMATNEKIAGSTSNPVVSDSAEEDRITASQDEALKVLHKEHGSDDWDKQEERSLLWKIDRKLFSLILISYVWPLPALMRNTN